MQGQCEREAGGPIAEVMDSVEQLLERAEGRGRTGQLWCQYLRMAALLKMYIFSTRTSNFQLQLLVIEEMIPIVHAAGHMAHAKCARLHVQQMHELKSVMPSEEYEAIIQYHKQSKSADVLMQIMRVSVIACKLGSWYVLHVLVHTMWMGIVQKHLRYNCVSCINIYLHAQRLAHTFL